jgi:ADP-ribose pyrophosphatase YjhB (NUDIX family)
MSREYPDRPIVGVGAVVIRDGAVLLVRRAKAPRKGQWSLPGGAQKLGETLNAAAIREVAEETGVEISIACMVDAVDSITHDDDGRVRYHYALFDVVATWIGGDLMAGGDADDARWVKLDELEPYALWAETRRVIARAAEMLET